MPSKTCGNCEHFGDESWIDPRFNQCDTGLPMILVTVEHDDLLTEAESDATACPCWKPKGGKDE